MLDGSSLHIDVPSQLQICFPDVDSSWRPWGPIQNVGPGSATGTPRGYPQHKVVYGKVKAGPVVGTAAVKVPQQDVPGVEQLRVQHAPNMQREYDPVREVRGRVHDGIWVPRNQNRRTRE